MVTGLTLLYVHCRNSVSPSISDQGAIEVKTDGLRAEDVKKTLLNDFRRVSDSDSQDRKSGSTPQNVLTKGGHRGEGVPASPQGEPAVSPPQRVSLRLGGAGRCAPAGGVAFGSGGKEDEA